jgi:hypothetical protein
MLNSDGPEEHTRSSVACGDRHWRAYLLTSGAASPRLQNVQLSGYRKDLGIIAIDVIMLVMDSVANSRTDYPASFTWNCRRWLKIVKGWFLGIVSRNRCKRISKTNRVGNWQINATLNDKRISKLSRTLANWRIRDHVFKFKTIN